MPCPGLQAAPAPSTSGCRKHYWPQRKRSSMGTKHYTLLGTGGSLGVPALSTSSGRGGSRPPLLILEAPPHGVGSGPTWSQAPRAVHRARPRPGPLRAALGGLCRPWDPGDPCASARLRDWDLPELLCVARAPRFPTSNFLPRCGCVHWPGRRGRLPGHLGATGQS